MAIVPRILSGKDYDVPDEYEVVREEWEKWGRREKRGEDDGVRKRKV